MLNANFIRHCYRQTGWIPAQPLTQSVAPGDICQIRNGQLQTLLNIFELNLTESILPSPEIKLATQDWRMSHGAQQTLCATEQTAIADCDDNHERSLWTKQIVRFDAPGSFMFHVDKPTCRLLLNWHRLKQDATLKLTQGHYSFRECYLVTGVTTASHWALAVAGQRDAQLQMRAALDSTDACQLLGHSSARSELCEGIASLQRAAHAPAHFFQAKKLCLSDAMRDHYRVQLIERDREQTSRELAAWLRGDLLNLSKSNELNLASAVSFFDWQDASLDDVERLIDSAQGRCA